MTRGAPPWLRTWSAVALAGAVTVASAVDGAVGSGALVDSPFVLLVAAASGYLLGAWTRPVVAVTGVLAAAVALTFASQRHFPEEYPVADDLAFFLIVLGAPAVAGASLVARAAQVRELAVLSTRLAEQRRDVVAAARLEEQHRIEVAVHNRLVEQMGAIALRAEGALRDADASTLSHALEDVEATARDGLDELRRALGLLREEDEEPTPSAEPGAVRRTGVVEPAPGGADLLLAAGMGAAMAVESVVTGSSRGPGWANVVAAFLVAAPLVARRRHPVLATAASLGLAALVSSALTPLLAMVTAIAVLLLTSYAVGAYARGGWRAVGVGVVWLGCLVIWLASPPEARDPEGLVPTLIWCTMAVAAGVLAAGWSERADRMRRVVADLEHGRDAEVRVAVARQRQEMARDLHDSVAHTLTVVCLNAGAARRGPEGSAGEALATITEASRTGMGELRRGLDALEPDEAFHPPSLQLLARRLGVDLSLAAPDELELSAPDTALLHRVLREAVVNAARHAPGARVAAELTFGDGRVRLEVVDDGPAAARAARSTAPLGTGSGLAGLATRLQNRGGELEFGPLHDRGFRVAATLPLTEEVPA